MFEIVTEYNKEIFFKCYKIHYKVFNKYNTKRTILLIIMCFVLATIALILGITKPETFHTVFASVFFYIMTLVFILGSNIMSDKGIKRTVDKIFNKNPNMNLTAKYIFNEGRFLSVHGENNTINYEYSDIRHFEVVDEYIIVLLKIMYYTSEEENYRKYGIVKINYLSSKLAVSDRTIQKIIKELSNEGLIKVESCFINGRQSGNEITYIGKPKIKTGKELTLDLLYDINNPYGFRDWDWMDFKLDPDLDLEERINQFEILTNHKEELKKRREKFLSK